MGACPGVRSDWVARDLCLPGNTAVRSSVHGADYGSDWYASRDRNAGRNRYTRSDWHASCFGNADRDRHADRNRNAGRF